MKTPGRWREIGYLPEQVSLYPELTVRRYLRFVAGMKGIDGGAARAAVDQALARCGLETVADRRTGVLSKGYRQRVGESAAQPERARHGVGGHLRHRPPCRRVRLGTHSSSSSALVSDSADA